MVKKNVKIAYYHVQVLMISLENCPKSVTDCYIKLKKRDKGITPRGVMHCDFPNLSVVEFKIREDP